jgi:hypothetical protein
VTLELAWAIAESIATSLDSARTGLDGTAGSAPAGVDAGDATPLVNQLLARVSESAAGLSEGLSAASGTVRMSATSFLNVDLGVRQGFQVGEP